MRGERWRHDVTVFFRGLRGSGTAGRVGSTTGLAASRHANTGIDCRVTVFWRFEYIVEEWSSACRHLECDKKTPIRSDRLAVMERDRGIRLAPSPAFKFIVFFRTMRIKYLTFFSTWPLLSFWSSLLGGVSELT